MDNENENDPEIVVIDGDNDDMADVDEHGNIRGFIVADGNYGCVSSGDESDNASDFSADEAEDNLDRIQFYLDRSMKYNQKYNKVLDQWLRATDKRSRRILKAKMSKFKAEGKRTKTVYNELIDER